MPNPLLRFPGSSIPAGALTGDEILDHYLADLDGLLIGGANVRLLTLLEVKDRLEQAKACRVGTMGADEAARAAVASMGSPDEHAAPQRAALWRRFFSVALPCGTVFAILMALFRYLDHRVVTPGWVAVQFVAFGSMLAWMTAFRLPPRSVPSTPAGEPFAVEYSRKVRIAHGGLSVLWVAAIVDAIPLVFGLSPLLGYSPLTSILLAAVALQNLRVSRLAFVRYWVERDGFRIATWRGSRRVAWSAVRSLRSLGDRRGWPALLRFGRHGDLLTYATEGGEATTTILPDMADRDRFVVRLRQHLER